ncbi:MAG TPA: tetratricopeptide repeat protein, partial [Thermoanaerobaculia bacterium]|nr:tetratricopeptide repeat protein [Thermoanaerobaculia bacterium]
ISTNFPTATRETGTGVIIGTLQYMSPEQKSGGRVDHRSDIFSLGVVMSEMMPDPPSALRRIMQKCMEKDPERRYQSARELLNDLDAVGKRRLPLVASLVAIAIIAVVAAAFLLTRRTPSTPITIPAQRPTNRSVAVLPFVNMSADTSNAFIADGMTEEIINALAQVPSLHVVSRTSSFAFKGQNADIRTIGSKLGVTSVVEGSVQRAGDRLRVTAQLINVDNGYHLWSEHYDRNVDDIFAVQDEIARAVAAALRARVGSTVVQAPTRDLVAYEAYLKGRQAAGVWTRQSFDRALANYRQAIDRDPSFAAAYAGLAELYSLMDHRAGLTTLPTSETYRLAIEAAQKSLSIDPGSAEAHGALGHIYMHLGRFAEADEHLRRSLALNPSSAMSHAWFAVLRRAQLRCDEAAAELSTALQLDPLNVLISSVGAANFLLCGDYEHSAAEARRGLQNDPENGDLLIAIGRAEMLQDHYDAARRALDDAERVAERGSSVEEHRALLLILEGKTREGLAELHRIEREKKAPGPEFIARAYAAAGDIDDALRWLERLIRERPNYARISIDLPPHPAFAALRKDPRYIALRRQLGLPD